jgi:hypothetical protein
MSEPSLLDYLLSIIDPRKERILLEGQAPSSDTQLEELVRIQDESITPEEIVSEQEKPSFPWRVLLAVLFLLTGQYFMEPPLRNWHMGLVFYGIAIVFLVISFFLIDWRFSSIPEEASTDQLANWNINWIPFVLGTFTMMTAFILFSGNVFRTGNILFWLISMVLYFQAFSQQNIIESIYKKFRQWIKGINFSKPLYIDWWTILIVLVTAVIVFFRFYQLRTVPGEMFSDHAEKLMDVSDIMSGHYYVYFTRNTGREAFQMYLTVLMAKIFGTGISFMSLKLGTAFAGLFTLPFIYLLGKEIANKKVGLLAYFLAGIAYWPNVIARVGLRFPLYPLFVAPVLFFLIRGLRQSRKWDFIWAGFFLGAGLHGYSPARMIPIVVIIGILIYLLHKKSKEERIGSLYGLIVITVISFVVFLPLLHFALYNMDVFNYRAMTRMGTLETTYPGNPLMLFLSNFFKAMVMFFWDNGEVWVHSIPHRPALDVVSAVFYFIGSSFVLLRYIKKRNWVDLFILLSVPLLMMPSIMSLAFPMENPALNRTGGAIIPVFILIAIGLDGFIKTIAERIRRIKRIPVAAFGLGGVLIIVSLLQNYDLVFNQYKDRFSLGSWNYSVIGDVIREFGTTYGDFEHAYVVPYPYWVDTQIISIESQKEIIDTALWPEDFGTTLDYKGAKLFIVKVDDYDSLKALQELYPTGSFWRHQDQYEGKDFFAFFVPPEESSFIIEQ